MNETSGKELSFQDGQIVWNYIFLSILFLAILFNNSLILTAVWSQKRIQSQLNAIILASMAFAQLIGGLLAIPINMALVQEYADDSRFKFSVVVTTLSGVATQLHLALLCIERYLVVVDSATHGKIKRGIVVMAAVVAWILSLLAALLSLVNFKNYSVFLATLFFILPFLCDILGYSILYRSSTGQNQTTLLKKELRLAKWFAAFTLLFNLFWFPFVVTILLRDHCSSCDTEKSSLYLFILYFQLLSLTISAAIFYKASLDFRLAFKMVASEMCNVLGRDTNQEPPSDALRDGSMAPESNRSHVNIAMFFDGESNRNSRQSEGSPQNQSPVPKTDYEEVHIVPFDQTKYLEAKETHEEFEGENEVDGGMSPDDEFGFHDIDIVPYDQCC